MTLAELLATEPYASISDSQAHARLAEQVQGARVPFSTIVDRLALDRTGEVSVLEAVQAAATNDAHAYYAACLRALTVLRTGQDYGLPGADLRAGTTHREMLDAMVDEAGDAGPMPQATRDAILALGLGPRWRVEHDLAREPHLGDIEQARAGA